MCHRRHAKIMKKTYETPVFYLEEFALNQAIASCGGSDLLLPQEGDAYQCVMVIDNNGDGIVNDVDSFLFIASGPCSGTLDVDGNKYHVKTISRPAYEADGEYDGVIEDYCYHVPNGSNILFNS